MRVSIANRWFSRYHDVLSSTSTVNRRNIDDNREPRLSSTTTSTCPIDSSRHFSTGLLSTLLYMATFSTKVFVHYHNTATRETNRISFMRANFQPKIKLKDVPRSKKTHSLRNNSSNRMIVAAIIHVSFIHRANAFNGRAQCMVNLSFQPLQLHSKTLTNALQWHLTTYCILFLFISTSPD